MPQETKSQIELSSSGDELAPGAIREELEGAVPSLATDQEIRDALEKAFSYRGDVTIATRSGSTIEGYIFDRSAPGGALADCYVRLLPKDSDEKVRISFSDIVRLEFSGRDTAAGKSFQTWIKKFQEKKAAGEKNIRIDPELI